MSEVKTPVRGRIARKFLPFRAVNCKGAPDHDPGLQRHHLLPRQLLAQKSLSSLFGEIGADGASFEDFRENGLLLPCQEDTARRLAMPLHRGPHRRYSELVIERVGQIEAGWSALRLRDREGAAGQALMRLGLLQRALRRFLLAPGRRVFLNRADPMRADAEFMELDAMADAIWGDCGDVFAGAGLPPVAAVQPPTVQPMPVRVRSSSSAA